MPVVRELVADVEDAVAGVGEMVLRGCARSVAQDALAKAELSEYCEVLRPLWVTSAS